MDHNVLTYLSLVPYMCVGELGQHWLRWWLVACSAPIHYLNQWWLVVNWTTRNKFPWNLRQNSNIFIQEHAFENVCQMAAILSRKRWVNTLMIGFAYMCQWTCPWFHIKMSHQYRKSHCGSYDRLISTMGFPILIRHHLYIESGPWSSLVHCLLPVRGQAVAWFNTDLLPIIPLGINFRNI